MTSAWGGCLISCSELFVILKAIEVLLRVSRGHVFSFLYVHVLLFHFWG